jgi:hypothetical protein
MKKHLFLMIAAAAGFALPNTLRAQWSFTASVTKMGTDLRCGLEYARDKAHAEQLTQKSYASKNECESAKQSLVNSSGDCVNVVCGPCTGPPEGNDGGFSDKFGDVDITGTNQGDPFYTQNPYDALTDAYEQKTFQNEKLLGEQGKATSTGDKDFDAKVAKFTGGRPASAEGIFNWEKQGRPSLNSDVKNNRAGGRPGSVGGFTGRPTGSSAANRYNGQMFQHYVKETSDSKISIDGKHGTGELHTPWGSATASVVLNEKQLFEMKRDIVTNDGIITKERHIVEEEIADLRKIENEAAKAIQTAETDAEYDAARNKANEAARKAKELEDLLKDYDNAKKNTPKDETGKPCDTQACKSADSIAKLNAGTALAAKIKQIRDQKAKKQAEAQKQQEGNQ